MSNSSKKMLGAVLAAGLLSTVALPAMADSVIGVRAGGEASRQNGAGSVEARLAPNGVRDSGFFLRIYGRHSVFGFDSAASATGNAEARTFGGNVSAGYQFAFGQILAAPYVGIDFFDRDISPAASDGGQLGDDIGVIVGGRVDNSAGGNTATDGSVVWSVDGHWASTNNDYFVNAGVGYDMGMLAVGPEAGAIGNDEYNAFRAGMFARLDLAYEAYFRFGGGVQFGNSGSGVAPASGGDSAYGTVEFGFDF